MLSAHFFGSLLFTCVGAFISWVPKGGTGDASSPPVEKLAGQVSPRNGDISETFFLTRFQMLHFPTFAK